MRMFFKATPPSPSPPRHATAPSHAFAYFPSHPLIMIDTHNPEKLAFYRLVIENLALPCQCSLIVFESQGGEREGIKEGPMGH